MRNTLHELDPNASDEATALLGNERIPLLSDEGLPYERHHFVVERLDRDRPLRTGLDAELPSEPRKLIRVANRRLSHDGALRARERHRSMLCTQRVCDRRVDRGVPPHVLFAVDRNLDDVNAAGQASALDRRDDV